MRNQKIRFNFKIIFISLFLVGCVPTEQITHSTASMPSRFKLPINGSTVILGHVEDAKYGEPMCYVNILIDSSSIGTSTDTCGNYKILDLPPGNYSIHTGMLYSKKAYSSIFKIDTNELIIVNFQLADSTVDTGPIY